jgi:hypothetical protein
MFWGQLGWLSKNVIWLPCGPHMTNSGQTTSCINSQKISKIKLVKVLNKLNWPHMVVRMSFTPTIQSTNCPLPFPIMLAWNIPKYWCMQLWFVLLFNPLFQSHQVIPYHCSKNLSWSFRKQTPYAYFKNQIKWYSQNSRFF